MLTGSEKDKSKELLENILAIPTVNSIDNEGELASFLADYFTKAGVPAQIHKIDAKHANVVARLEGRNPDRTLVLNGHLDTVPYGDLNQWDSDPAQPVEKDGRIFGRGASDMKSGLAMLAFTLADFARRGVKPQSNCLLIGTCDEENGGMGARQVLKDNLLKNPDLILIGEPTGNDLGIAQKGCVWVKITVRGKTSHGAYPSEGINSVEHASQICGKIKEFVEQDFDRILGGATAEITKIIGGVAPNMVPDYCEAVMDIRTVTVHQHKCFLEDISRLLDDYLKENPGLEAGVEILNNRRAVAAQEDNGAVELLSGIVQKETGKVPKQIGINFFSDASIFTARYPELPVFLFGPGEPELCHKLNESVMLEKYYDAISCLREFLNQF